MAMFQKKMSVDTTVCLTEISFVINGIFKKSAESHLVNAPGRLPHQILPWKGKDREGAGLDRDVPISGSQSTWFERLDLSICKVNLKHTDALTDRFLYRQIIIPCNFWRMVIFAWSKARIGYIYFGRVTLGLVRFCAFVLVENFHTKIFHPKNVLESCRCS